MKPIKWTILRIQNRDAMVSKYKNQRIFLEDLDASILPHAELEKLDKALIELVRIERVFSFSPELRRDFEHTRIDMEYASTKKESM
jgi:hypothetical protein